MDEALVQRLTSQMSRGDVVLFTGAGFSLGAAATSGRAVPSSEELRRELWPLAFPGSEPDNESTLGEVYDNAVRQAGNRVKVLCEALFRIDPASLPDHFRLWWSAPWCRAYTLNVDDLDEAAGRQFALSRPLRSVSALSDLSLRGHGTGLESVHLNGRARDFPDMTFSPRQYGERTASPDAWYQSLVADLAGKPVLFVGTSLDEPPLWHYLAMRGGKERRVRELRPGSYLVTPNLSRARQGLLKDLNIDWVPMTQQEFAEDVLAGLGAAYQKGHEFHARANAPRGRRSFYIVGSQSEPSDTNTAEFLMGREPTWRDLTDGYAIARDFEDELCQQIDDEQPRVTLITGTAGSGKSTTLRALALRYRALGKAVAWVDIDAEVSIPELRRELAAAAPDVIVVDDADRFGRSSAGLLADLAQQSAGVRIFAGARSTSFERLDFTSVLESIGFLNFVVPHLEDRDITGLLEALQRANRLGRLRGKPAAEQVKAFRDAAGRQLIVAMLEATSGERFEDKLDRECEEIGLDLGLIYAIVSVVTSLRHFVTRDEILLAVGDSSNEMLGRIDTLASQRLLVTSNGSEIRVRHRVVAERALNHYRRNGQLGEALRGVLFAMAAKVDREASRKSRQWLLLIRLMNHEMLKGLADDASVVRDAYQEIENLLSWDYQYWLQRGSFEVQVGDIRLAQNFLEQARALAPDDPKVQTEWSYMMLKRAYQDPANPSASEWARVAFEELEDAIQVRGRVDSYPYHVLGSQGLAWVRRALFSDDERIELLSRLRSVMREARRLHPGVRDLEQLSHDVERQYLSMALPPEQRRPADS